MTKSALQLRPGRDFERHEARSAVQWDTKIVCECGERCANWMEFYRHRGDAYLAVLTERYGS